MGEKNRIFGFNLKYYLWEKKIASSDFAENLGYSIVDLWRIEDAQIILERREREEIANALDVSLDDMFKEKSEHDYELAQCFECRGHFENENNKKKILDLLDTYCDIQEMLTDSRV